MTQYTLTQDYNGYKANTVFQGPYPIKGQSSKCYVPLDQIPGPDGAEMCLFSSFVESSTLFKLVTNENKT